MRASNGASLPLHASIVIAPATSAASNTSCERNSASSASAVEICVPFRSASPSFGPSVIGCKPMRSSAARAGMVDAVHPHLALADQRARHMRQRRKVTRGADRALRWDHRIRFRVEQFQQSIDDDAAHAGTALRERQHFQRQRQAHDAIRQIGPDAAGVRHHEIALQLFESAPVRCASTPVYRSRCSRRRSHRRRRATSSTVSAEASMRA